MVMHWYQETSLYEFLSTSIFWGFGVLTIGLTFWTTRQINLFDEHEHATKSADNAPNGDESNDPRTSATAMPRSPGRHNVWLQPHITSRPRQIHAIVVSTLLLGVELLEGSWVLRTACRFTVAVWKGTWLQMKSYVVGLVCYLPITLVMVAAWVAVLCVGLYIVSAQVLYIIKLSELRPGARISQSISRRTRESEKKDDEWDGLEEEEVLRNGNEQEKESLL
ncbi:hypothetical protein AB5N19_07025 [Seiridium cardinale]